MVASQLALLTAAIFTGAAIYVSVSEQPARLALEDRAMLTQWKPSYKHGAAMQSGLALIACGLGLWAWRQSGHLPWLLGALAIVSAWPYTLLVIRPTNNELLATGLADAGPRTRALIVKWGRLHLVRTSLGVVTTTLFLWGSLG